MVAGPCVMVNVRPPAWITAVRDAVDGLWATVNRAVPLPFPEVEPFRVIQVLVSLAVHEHPVAAVTPIVPVPPVGGRVCVDGVMAKVQVPAACVTVWLRPPIVSVAERAVGTALAATE